ncbi:MULTISPECIES: SAV_915 family protein [unclassified Nocardia]|uniref:SAV_915 family protein n=1 Tax=unclassified Nocardia TaxID=2637762 RepID=UPI0027E30A1D|nr:SAV_915 family protein [Nocardia sp. MH4]
MPENSYYNRYEDFNRPWDGQSVTDRRKIDANQGTTPDIRLRQNAKLPKRFPPVVYLPILSEVDKVEQAQIMLRQTRDGRIACLAYSALDRLLECCGEDQPWMWTPVVALDALQGEQPFDLLLLDLDIPTEHRWGSV